MINRSSCGFIRFANDGWFSATAGAIIAAALPAGKRCPRLNLAVVLPVMGRRNALPAPTGPAWRAVLLNVRTENRRHDLVKSFLVETNPDFVVLEEVDSS